MVVKGLNMKDIDLRVYLISLKRNILEQIQILCKFHKIYQILSFTK